MPRVLHVIPPDATLSAYGLEAWLDAGRGFLPVVAALGPTAWAERGDRWDLFPVHPLPRPRSGVSRLAARLRPGQDPWLRFLMDHQVSLVHLHDDLPAADFLRAARQLDVPVVASAPGLGDSALPFERMAHVLAPSPARADWVRERTRGRVPVRVAPPPIAPPEGPARRMRGEPKPLRWVTSISDAERGSLGLVVRAFARYAADSAEPATLTVLLAGPWVAEARAIIDAYAPGADISVLLLGDAAGLRAALAAAHAAVFPLADAQPSRGEGLTWPAWVAAGLGLPLVLGRGPAELDGLRDHQGALLTDPEEGAMASRMQFLATRPYVWPTLGQTARQLSTGRLAYDRACEIPFEVYRQVLRAHAATALA